jgi:hypothetical protein
MTLCLLHARVCTAAMAMGLGEADTAATAEVLALL